MKIRRYSIFKYSILICLLLLCWGILLTAVLVIHGKRILHAGADVPDSSALAQIQWLYQHRYFPSAFHTALPLLSCSPCQEAVLPPPAITARSAVVIDAASRALLYEKNPQLSIPPASLTKLVAIFTAFQAIEKGEIHLHDMITPPPQAWHRNIPAGSSLMFLDKDQRVTVEELIRGMSVVSGNDAAIALAIHTAGSVAAFVERMNVTAAALGLQDTSFVEPTGLSEHNRTTARDFARFCAVYLQKYPENLQRFHAVTEFVYPKKHNSFKSAAGIRQMATNTLLSSLAGCDGLKTGFIYESGFNIALTAERNGTRFIAVILGSTGNTFSEGKKNREKDSHALMEWAFRSFQTVVLPDIFAQLSPIPVLGSCDRVGTAAFIPVPFPLYHTQSLAVTALRSGSTGTPTVVNRIAVPPYIIAPVAAGSTIGMFEVLQHIGNETVLLAQFPLLASKYFTTGSTLSLKYDQLAIDLVQTYSVKYP